MQRPDANLLKTILNGAWSYDELISWAGEQEELVSELHNTSELKQKPDYEKIKELCVEIMEEAEKDKFGY